MNEVKTAPAKKDGCPTGLSVSTGYRLLSASKEYKLTRKCPYCGGALRMSINGCELDEATGWIATDLDINCDTEPDIDGPDWEGWWADHSNDFCHRWHDLHATLVATLKFTHRVLHDNAAYEPTRQKTLNENQT